MKILLVLFCSLINFTHDISAMRDFNEFYKALQVHHARSPYTRDLCKTDHDVYEDALKPYFSALRSAINDVEKVKGLLAKEPFRTYWYELKTPNFPYMGAESVIQLALGNGNIEILKLLLRAGLPGVRPNVNNDYCSVLESGREWRKNYLLHDALRNECLDIARMLLNAKQEIGAYRDADVNIAGYSASRWTEETPLIIALHKYNAFKAIAGQDREERLAEWIEIIKIILEHEAQIVFSNTYGDNPLYYCQKNDLPEVIELFNPHLEKLYQIIQWEKDRGLSICRGRQESKDVLRTLIDQGVVVRCDDGSFIVTFS